MVEYKKEGDEFVNKIYKSPKFNRAIFCILFISLIINVFLSINSYKNKYAVGDEAYNSTINIKLLNEKNNEIISDSIQKGSISSVDLLKLDKNYSNISDSITKLLAEYSYYSQNRSFLSKKRNIAVQDIAKSEVNSRIEEYLNVLLQKEMVAQTSTIKLDGEYLEKFQIMKSLSDEIKDYYVNFDSEKLEGLEFEDKKNKIIKEYYWVDNLEAISKINTEFIDSNFVIKQ